MPLHTISVAIGAGIFVFYVGFNTLLQYLYYVGKAGRECDWKSQPKKSSSVGDSRWWLPILSRKDGRPPHYALFATVNVLLQVASATITVELMARGKSLLRFGDVREQLHWAGASFFLGIVLHMLLEYYWHRLMHLRWFYCTFHKYHHFFKSPEPFDDMYIHPLEALGYYIILYSTPFLIPMHWISFVGYMAVVGLAGVMDHSGIRFYFPLFYASEDHDLHHEKFEVNYSFPFMWMDMVHGTFRGTYAGFEFKGRIREKHAVVY